MPSENIKDSDSTQPDVAEKSEKCETQPSPPPVKPEGEPDAETEPEYPTGFPLALITIGLCLSTFVIALDNTIIATAIPKITTVFNSLDDIGWYGSAYFLTLTSLQPSFGKIYTNFSIKGTFLTSLVIFEVGSVICAAARSSKMLIVGRAVAGVGASAIFAGGMNILTYTVPLHKRAIYLASVSSMFAFASIVGPLLGGAFTDKVTWRWCFWINLPIGGFTFFVLLIFFKPPHRHRLNQLTFREKIAQIDIVGAFFLIGGIVCLLLALQWGGQTYPWKDSKVWGLFIGFALSIAVFIGIQIKRQEHATIPPPILRQRTVLVSAMLSLLLFMTMFTHIFYLPFYFQAIKGTTAVQSGIRTIPYLVSLSVASVAVGGAVTVIGIYYPFLWVGSAVYIVGCGMISTLDVGSGTGKWLGYQLIAGFGGGAAFQIPFLAVQVVLPTKDIPVGTSLVMFFNTLGGAISLSIAQNIFSNELVNNLRKDAPMINPAVVVHAGATGLRSAIPSEFLSYVLTAYAKALQTVFIPVIAFSGLAFISSLFIERINVKGKSLMPGGA